MSDLQELERLALEAAAAEQENEPGPVPGQNADIPPAGDVVEDFAAFLDMAALAGGQYFMATIPQRFSHQANVNVSAAAVKLCERYGYDPRAVLLGGDSTLSLWLGLGLSLLIPGFACYQDYKLLKAKEVREADGGDSGDNEQQPQ